MAARVLYCPLFLPQLSRERAQDARRDAQFARYASCMLPRPTPTTPAYTYTPDFTPAPFLPADMLPIARSLSPMKATPCSACPRCRMLKKTPQRDNADIAALRTMPLISMLANGSCAMRR